MLKNETRNQHFVCRAEQKLNAIDPTGSKPRIYAFKVTDRDKYTLELESDDGVPISSNLAFLDLFSFDVPGGQPLRHNFEVLFQKYESNISTQTDDLLQKLRIRGGCFRSEIINLFAAKMLNFVRNPFCIAKVLSSFPTLAGYHPTDPVLLASYQRIKNGRRPHQKHLCSQLGITDAQYVEWLSLLFMLLVPMADGCLNFFEEAIKGLLEDRKTYVAATICDFDTDHCLVSDRGFSRPIEDGPHLAFSFNLCSSAFVHFIFADPATLLEGKAHPDFLKKTLADWEQRRESQINVTFLRNNTQLLAQYNRRVIEQCHGRVFCSRKDGLLL